MEKDEEVTFTKNKRLTTDGSHIGGPLYNRVIDPINDVKLNKRGMSIEE